VGLTAVPFKVCDQTIVIIKRVLEQQCASCSEYVLEDIVMAQIDKMLAQANAAAELEAIESAMSAPSISLDPGQCVAYTPSFMPGSRAIARTSVRLRITLTLCCGFVRAEQDTGEGGRVVVSNVGQSFVDYRPCQRLNGIVNFTAPLYTASARCGVLVPQR